MAALFVLVSAALLQSTLALAVVLVSATVSDTSRYSVSVFDSPPASQAFNGNCGASSNTSRYSVSVLDSPPASQAFNGNCGASSASFV